MMQLLSCRYNMDTNRVEARFEDEITLAIDCIAIENEYGNAPAQRAELDWLLYNKPLEYAQLVLPTVSLLCTPFAPREKENRRVFVHIKGAAMLAAFLGCKYGLHAADFQDEAVWGVIWLADK